MSLKVLPVVKAYPVIDPVSQTEAVCVAGISMETPYRWIRLFPLDYRGLVYAQRFKKYEAIELKASKSTKDSRPESFTPVLDSIIVGELIGTDNGTWRRRLPFFDAVEDQSMCEIQRRQKTERKSLGVFRPLEVTDLKVTAAEEGFVEAQRALLNQPSLFGDGAGDDTRAALEPLPVKAKFAYRCSDPACPGHEQSLIDWELGALYRSLGKKGDDETTIHVKIRQKFFEQYCSDHYDTRFITGSMLRHPGSFLILGLVHPKRQHAPRRRRCSDVEYASGDAKTLYGRIRGALTRRAHRRVARRRHRPTHRCPRAAVVATAWILEDSAERRPARSRHRVCPRQGTGQPEAKPPALLGRRCRGRRGGLSQASEQRIAIRARRTSRQPR